RGGHFGNRAGGERRQACGNGPRSGCRSRRGSARGTCRRGGVRPVPTQPPGGRRRRCIVFDRSTGVLPLGAPLTAPAALRARIGPRALAMHWLPLTSVAGLAIVSLYLGRLPSWSLAEWQVLFVLFVLFVAVRGLEESGLILR